MDTDPVVLIDSDNLRTICFLFVMICLANVVSGVGAGETRKRLGFIDSGNFTVGCFLRWSASSALESGNILDFEQLTCCQTTRCPDFVGGRKVKAVYSTTKSFSSPFPRKERAGGIAAVWRNHQPVRRACSGISHAAKKPPTLIANEAGQSGLLYPRGERIVATT